jgi:hypothetical protein
MAARLRALRALAQFSPLAGRWRSSGSAKALRARIVGKRRICEPQVIESELELQGAVSRVVCPFSTHGHIGIGSGNTCCALLVGTDARRPLRRT